MPVLPEASTLNSRTHCPSCHYRITPLVLECPQCGLSLARQPLEHHARVLAQGSGKVGAREELRRVAVVFGSTTRNNLLQGNRKLVGIEGTSLAYLLAWQSDLVPGIHSFSSLRHGPRDPYASAPHGYDSPRCDFAGVVSEYPVNQRNTSLCGDIGQSHEAAVRHFAYEDEFAEVFIHGDEHAAFSRRPFEDFAVARIWSTLARLHDIVAALA